MLPYLNVALDGRLTPVSYNENAGTIPSRSALIYCRFPGIAYPTITEPQRWMP